jgi:DHA1 family inner membrane transport protein
VTLVVLLCVTGFASTFSLGVFPALLPDIAATVGLADRQLGVVAGAFGLARMAVDLPVGLFITHHLRRALLLAPLVQVAGLLVLATADSFGALLAGRALAGVGSALGMVGTLTALLRHAGARRLGSALNAHELSAMLGILGGVTLLGLLPTTLAWGTALLLACTPQVIALAVLPWVLRALPPNPPGRAAPLFAMRSGTSVEGRGFTPLAATAFLAGGVIAVTYSAVEGFLVPLRGTRELGLDRVGVSRLLMTTQLADIVALVPTGLLADRGRPRGLLVAVLAVLAVASIAIAAGTLPVVVAGCALFGLGMAGWMLPVAVLRRETPASQIAWRTALYRVGVDGGLFLGPFAAGLVGAAPLTLALAGVLLLVAVLVARTRPGPG